MEDERDKLRRDLEHFHFLLTHTADPQARHVIRDLIAEAERRVRTLDGKAG
jgi:hypothetical protein